MKTLKEFKEPTTIVITGQWVEGIKESLMITDDESSIDVRRFDGNSFSLTTFGHLYILTEEQFNWFISSDHYKMYCDDDFGEIENMYVVIKDYVGTIGATGIDLNQKEFDNWNINKYFYHQNEDSYPILDITGNYNTRSMNINEVKEFLASDASDNGSVKSSYGELLLQNRIASKVKNLTLEEKMEVWGLMEKMLNKNIAG